MEKDVEMEARTIADDILEDLDVCKECTGTWKVACYGAWSPNSQFWEDFLEDGWEEGAYSPRACCLRLMCGLLFLFFAPIWCCKAIFFCLFWPCICCCRAARDGNCNREYFKIRRSKYSGNSQPLAYIESAHPSPPNEISYQFSAPRGIPPESPIPEIRIETELENGTYVTSPVEDCDLQLPPANGHQLPTITITSDRARPAASTNGHPLPSGNGRQLPSANGRPLPSSAANSPRSQSINGRRLPAATTNHVPHSRQAQGNFDADPPPPYPMTESPGGATKTGHRNRSSTQPARTSTNHSSSPHASPSAVDHSAAKNTMSSKAKSMDNNLYRAVVLEGITGKVTTV